MRALLLLAALGGCVPAEAPAPADPAIRIFRGAYAYGFETSRFDGCWLDLSPAARAEFDRRQPEAAQAGRAGGFEYEITFEGRREDYRGPAPGGFGHMAHYQCQYEAIRLLDSRLVYPTPDLLERMR